VSKAQNPSIQVVPFVPIALQLWLKDSPLKSAFGIIIISSQDTHKLETFYHAHSRASRWSWAVGGVPLDKRKYITLKNLPQSISILVVLIITSLHQKEH
jgi:hypothetical protein